MDNNIPVVHIASFNTKNSTDNNNNKNSLTENNIEPKKAIITQTVYSNSMHIAYNSFINWIHNSDNNTFKVSSCTHYCIATISINNVLVDNKNKCNIVYLIEIGNLSSKNVYEVKDKLGGTDIENIFDIVLLIIRVSTGDISYYSDRSMIGLIHMQMDRVGIKV